MAAPMSEISSQIWDMKYRLKASDGTPVDEDVAHSWARVALAAAKAERPEKRAEWAQRFAEALADYRFLPAGRILAGAGTDRSVTLFNCFVMGTIPDSMCRTIMSAGSRRGAMMATLACDHPDIEEFIDAKRAKGRLSMFNLSVLATDRFMAAVKEDAAWDLKFGGKTFKTVRARELWDRIMRATYEYAEPGVIFIDRINNTNNL